MMASRFLVLAGLAMLLTPASAQACVRFRFLDGVLQQAYDPFSPATLSANVIVGMERTDRGEADRVAFVLVDAFQRGSDPGVGLDGPAQYDVIWPDDPSRQFLSTGTTPLGPFSGANVTLGDQQTATATLRILIPPGQTVMAGRHAENFAIRYRCYSGDTPIGGEQEQPTSEMTGFAINVARVVTARLAGEQTEGRIDFGVVDADTNLSRSISVSARSTTPYVITLESVNGGVMIGDGGLGAVRYRLTFDNVELPVGGELRCPIAGAPNGIYAMLGVELSRDDVISLPAGHYNDTVTLTFAPLDGFSEAHCTGR